MEESTKETQEQNQTPEEVMEQMEQRLSQKIDDTINVTAHNFEKAADKMKEAANFIREKNSSTLKEDVSTVVRDNPVKTVLGGLLLGFLFGKLLKF